MDDQKFLWVNKSADSSSLTRSDRSESQEILRFVQQNRTQDAVRSTGQRRTRRGERGSSTGLVPVPADDNLSGSSHRKSSQSLSPTTKGHSRRQSAAQILPAATPFAALDPFESCAITITRQVQVLIHYYWQILATGWLVDRAEVLPARLRPVRRYENVRDQSMAGLMQDKVRVTALLAVMASRMVYLSKISVPQVNAEQFILTALHTLRQHMSDQSKEQSELAVTVLYAIHSLALAEVYRRRYDDALVHLKQLKGLMSTAKITSVTHSYVAEAMINIDGLISIETGRIPIMAYSFDPGALPERRAREIATHLAMARNAPPVLKSNEADESPSPMIYDAVDFLADASTSLDFRAGEGLNTALGHCEVILPIIAPLIKDLLEVVEVAKLVWLTNAARESDARWMCQRSRVLTHRLLSLKEQLQDNKDPAMQRMESLRIALLLVMIRCTSRVAPRAAQVNIQLLMASLEGQGLEATLGTSTGEDRGGEFTREAADDTISNPDFTGAEYQWTCLLLFILLTGHYNAMVAADPSQTWFLEKATHIASNNLGLTRFRELDEMMRRYLYNPSQQAVSLRFVAMHL